MQGNLESFVIQSRICEGGDLTYLYVLSDYALISLARRRVDVALRINLDPAPIQLYSSVSPIHMVEISKMCENPSSFICSKSRHSLLK